MLIAGLILTGVCVAAAVTWAVVYVNARANDRMLPDVGEGLPHAAEGPLPRVSVVLSMHNEERDAPGCIASLRAQDYPNLQIVLSLDRCTDATPTIAREAAAADPRVVMVEAEPREGWWGKCVPLDRGLRVADGRWLLSIDADTRLDPTLIRAAVGLARHRGWDMIGVLPRLSCDRAFEAVVQPVATMQMMYMFSPLRINRETDRRPFGLGPFMMFSRAACDAAGLMDSVKDDIQEDVALAREIHRAGYRVGLASHGGLLTCRMFDGFGAFYHGWKRIFTRISGNRVGRLRKYALRLALLGVCMPAAQAAALGLGIAAIAAGALALGVALLAAAGVAFAAQLLSIDRIYRRGGLPGWARLTYPLGFAVIAWLLHNAAASLKAGKPVRWAGREYTLKPR